MTPLRRRRSGSRSPIRGDEDLTLLATRAGAGDPEAEAAFVARTIDDVWRYCAHLLDARLADDATQATYLRALPALSRFRGESSPRTWLLGVARNTCLDERRSLARRTRLAGRLAAERLDEATPSASDTTLESADALRALDPDRREAFVLTQILGFSYEEAAEAAGCPVGTIRSRVARARVDLVRLVADEGPSAATIA